MATSMDALAQAVTASLGERVELIVSHDELTLIVKPPALLDVMKTLRDDRTLAFGMLIDACGVDYATYANQAWEGPRFACVYHLLSLPHNWRVRVRSFAQDDDFPVLPSVIELWPAVNWFEREAFDLYGLVFEGHPDLRRLLTDYGFVGHPFRKDFPLSGHVEMRYDPEQRRVVYQPVTIEPREVVPRVVREEKYGDVSQRDEAVKP
ncbi:MAG TPA: NADH-quinone oxidoreductase subunit C [Casimicrobiaceae bacterium]|nr:NADH-quinone oxidoreductase subunit C [Casimicrobiaceae bacterium]